MKKKNNRVSHNGDFVNSKAFSFIPANDEIQYIKNSRLWAVWSPLRGLVYHSVRRSSCVSYIQDFCGSMIPYRVVRFDPHV